MRKKKIENSQWTLKKTSNFCQIQGSNEFKNWEFPCLLYTYGYKKDDLFWEFSQEKMSKHFGNPESSGGGGRGDTINFWNSPIITVEAIGLTHSNYTLKLQFL